MQELCKMFFRAFVLSSSYFSFAFNLFFYRKNQSRLRLACSQLYPLYQTLSTHYF